MTVTLVVMVLGVMVALAVVVASRWRRVHLEALSPDHVEHWLVESALRWPRLARALDAVDRRVVGSAGLIAFLVVLWAAALAVGFLFDSLDTGRGFARWDESVASWGSDHATGASTTTLRWTTHLGDSLWLGVTMTALGAFDYLRRRHATVVWYLFAVGLGVVVLNNALKLLVDRDRPDVPHLVGASGSSFPSGHSATAAACWAAIAFVATRHLPRRARPYAVAVAVGVATLVATSRALLGVHWLTDVIAGVIVGWAWFFLVSLTFGGRLMRLGDAAEIIAARSESGAEDDSSNFRV